MSNTKPFPRGLLTLLPFLAGCTPTPVEPATGAGSATSKVTGSITYRERIALPPSAVVAVKLVDVSLADAPAVLIAEQIIRNGSMPRAQPHHPTPARNARPRPARAAAGNSG